MIIPDATVDDAAVAEFVRIGKTLEQTIGTIVVGQATVVREVLIAVLAGGHVLLEGVPGLGKTLLVRTIGDSLGLSFARVQFTPDLMPADVTGTNIIAEDEHGRRTFRFQPGPLFANVILADEINRATPKTQSALLEAMQEGTVTVGDATRELPRPFLVLATQNPLEMEGTYPLPEAQLDRFFVKVMVPFPGEDILRGILSRTLQVPERVQAVADGATLLRMVQVARAVPVASTVADTAIRMLVMTHPDHAAAPPEVRRFGRAGASPRGLQALVTGAQVRALLEGRFNASVEDLRALAHPVLRHRMLTNFDAQAEGVGSDQLIERILNEL